MADSVGTLKANIVANAAGFVAGMGQAAAAAVTSGGKIRSALLGVQSLGGQLGGIIPEQFGSILSTALSPGILGLGLLAAAFRQSQVYAGQAKETFQAAARTGMGVVAYQELGVAARKSGVEIGIAEAAVSRMRRAVSEGAQAAREGKLLAPNPGAKALAELGLGAQQLETMGPDKALEKVAEALGRVQNSYQRARLEQELFGESGTKLDPLLRTLQKGGLGQFKNKVLAPEDLQALKESKVTFTQDMPTFFKRRWAKANLWTQDIGADVGAGRFGSAAMRFIGGGMSGKWGGVDLGNGEATQNARALGLQEDDRNRARAKAAFDAAEEAAKHQLGGFGEMAQAGSQAAYQASTAWQYGLEDKAAQQVEILQQIRDRLPAAQSGGSDAEPVG
jgi:hypothetical protein